MNEHEMYSKNLTRKIRNVEDKDFNILFKWINNEEVIKNSKYGKGKSLEEFKEYFETKSNSNNCYMFIMEDETNYIGQINFEIDKSESILNYSVDKQFRNMGIGKELVKWIEEFIFNNLQKVEKISAYVRSSNIPSIKVFEGLGFIIEISEKDYVKLIRQKD